MFQLIYVSSATTALNLADVGAILAVSRRNNRADDITGMLYADQRRFLQALEGDEAKVRQTFSRIERDSRHRAVVLLSQRQVAAREFGEWEMAHALPGHDADALMTRVAELAAGAAPSVKATFEGFVAARRAA